MSKGRKYMAIGYVVSKFVIPMAKRQAKKRAKGAARGAVTGATGAMKRSPAKTSLLIGTAVGAAGWLLSRNLDSADTHANGDDNS